MGMLMDESISSRASNWCAKWKKSTPKKIRQTNTDLVVAKVEQIVNLVGLTLKRLLKLLLLVVKPVVHSCVVVVSLLQAAAIYEERRQHQQHTTKRRRGNHEWVWRGREGVIVV